MPDLERNKANVIAFYDLACNQGRPPKLMDRYAAAGIFLATRAAAVGDLHQLRLHRLRFLK